ncbi:Very late factor-1 [Trabala vishnou gigantina nucleopolyhedrovirus]|uniref:Very late factor-1 n=1 Tax=Trabala vishnou gigantina nucleopolyhedrovirus TaxID=2863583 RepID=UPI002481FB4E|nr:Very late factor-1 [Trabala vishnou gigantina nucleopolyhedrovirus]QYC92678.1 Very late factor-1 [Trabala vishnou gigantina nucleopolyhedrovirus]
MNVGNGGGGGDEDELRNENVFNYWKSKIQNHDKFETVFNLATDRQRCTPEEVKKNSLWSQYMFPKPFAATTLKSYKSRLIKLIFCLIDDKNLKNHYNYSLDDEFESIVRQRPRISCEEMCRRMLEVRSVTKETLQLTINFYTNCMSLPEYKIPRQVMLPRDKELKHIKTREKNVVLKEIIDSVLNCIQKKLKYLNGDDVHDRGLLRGAIVFCIMLGTGMRINEARHLSVDDLSVLIKKGKMRNNIDLKRKKSRSNLLNTIKSKPLELAREIYAKHPTILQISKNTSTPFKDFKRLFEEAGVEMDRPRSNMIRHYLSSNLYNNGMPLQKVAKLMNHNSFSSTRHYLNKYNVGVNESSSDNDEDDNDNTNNGGGVDNNNNNINNNNNSMINSNSDDGDSDNVSVNNRSSSSDNIAENNSNGNSSNEH